MKSSTIFKSRWMALLWAAGILWFAYDVAGGSESSTTSNASTNADQATDVTGAPITTDDEKKFEQAINGL